MSFAVCLGTREPNQSFFEGFKVMASDIVRLLFTMEFQPDCALGVPGTADLGWKTEIFLFLTGILQRKQNIYFLTNNSYILQFSKYFNIVFVILEIF